MTDSNPQSPVVFARGVVQQLREIAQDLAKENDIRAFCSPLTAELANLQEHFGNDDRNQSFPENRVVKLLDNFEKLCQVSLCCGQQPLNQITNISFDSGLRAQALYLRTEILSTVSSIRRSCSYHEGGFQREMQ